MTAAALVAEVAAATQRDPAEVAEQVAVGICAFFWARWVLASVHGRGWVAARLAAQLEDLEHRDDVPRAHEGGPR